MSSNIFRVDCAGRRANRMEDVTGRIRCKRWTGIMRNKKSTVKVKGKFNKIAVRPAMLCALGIE